MIESSAAKSDGSQQSERTSRQIRSTGVQRRGAERVRSLLAAAEELLGEQGYEAATLKAIGEKAGVPTASVYHYFADRGQIEAELLRRYSEELDERMMGALGALEPCGIREVVDAVIDVVVEYFRENASVAQLWFVGRSLALETLARESDGARAEQFRAFLVESEFIAADTPVLVLKLAYEAADRIFDVAFRHSNGDDATIEEARRMITAYMETYSPKARE